MEWINFRHLYAFWMVSRHGGFKNAAEKMFVSQSAISDHVAQLENYFDEKLFDRTTRRVRLTNTGKELLQYAESIFTQSREINQVIKLKQQPGAVKRLSIGMVGGISRNFVFRSLTSMFEKDQDLTVDVINGSYDELNYMLRQYDLDVLISLELPQKKDLPNLAYTSIGSSRMCLAGKKSIMQKYITDKKSSEDNNDKVPVFQYNILFEGDMVKDVLIKKMKIACHSRMSTDDISLLRFFANSGQGLVLIPEIGVQEDANQGVLLKQAVPGLPKVSFYAIYLKDSQHQEMIGRLF